MKNGDKLGIFNTKAISPTCNHDVFKNFKGRQWSMSDEDFKQDVYIYFEGDKEPFKCRARVQH